MTRAILRSWIRLPAVSVTAALIVLWLGFEAWSSVEAERKLEEAGLAGSGGPVDVEVVLSISAEQFHMTLLQDVGRLVGVDARHALLMDVPRESLRTLARNYWVLAIHPRAGR